MGFDYGKYICLYILLYLWFVLIVIVIITVVCQFEWVVVVMCGSAGDEVGGVVSEVVLSMLVHHEGYSLIQSGTPTAHYN